MSNEPSQPGDDVPDGGRDGTRHIPRDPREDEGTTATDHPGAGAGTEALDSGNGNLPGVPGSTEDAIKSSGPAEEQDNESPEARGRTTYSSPSEQ